ncbi:o-succinylbenzoate synthase [Silvibacterium dinghuense]|uniref:o-succinylbenzoate synthase n=1 Tax=Silvibacterium dinghuense TaxID=1560006 RepID=A0A4Q1SGB3_9BACT|nr:o-succinylbenzoate synthase [Silvibacterium dinghuense]RXS96395.1 o-succinylbenzoate synthase [Silvibacterium dinghuense]GGG90422.1 o-succinylbenzoate synthase [Silvibacterium dinghuense]
MRIDAIYLRELHIPLVQPFETSFGVTTDRRVLLVELKSEGLTAWGECVAGEHPYFSDETIDTAWLVMTQELAPVLASTEVEHAGKIPSLFRQVRGHRMAKAALENAVWDLEAQVRGIALAELLGGSRETIPCGVSIGIQPTLERQLAEIEKELAAGYQRIKLKCKPGWDTKVFEAVRKRWPDIVLSCDANSAYRLKDADHIREWDNFNLLMIEQPLWYDDFYFHSLLQKQLNTAICLDESIRNRRDALAAIEMESCRIINIKNGRVGGFSEAIAVHNAAQERGIPVWCGGMLESGIGRSHNIALSSLPNFSLPGDVSASKRYWKEDIIEPEVTVSAEGEIVVPAEPGRGFAVREDLVERLTVRKEEIRALALA